MPGCDTQRWQFLWSEYISEESIQLIIFQFQMETKAMPSFLEISINTDKFAHFTNTLNSILNAHDKTLQQHTKELHQLKINTDDKLFRIRKEIQYEGEKAEKKRKEDSQYFSTFLNDWTLKHERFADEWRGRITNFEEKHSKVYKKTKASQGGSDETALSEIKVKISDIMNEFKQSLQKEVTIATTKMEKMEQQLKSSVVANQYLLKNILENCQNKTVNDKDAENTPNTVTIQRKGQREPTRLLSGGISIQQMTIKEGRDKRRRKVQQKCEQQNLQYASVSAKIDEIQNRISAKQNQSLNKVVWANHKPDMLNSQLSQNNLSLSMNQIQLERKNLEQNITFKLEHIQDIIEQKFAKIEKQMNRMANAHGILADEVEIAGHRAEKEKLKFTEVCLQLKKFQEKKLDEKMVDNLMNTMKRQNRIFEENIDKKMTQQIFDKEKQRINQKLQVVTESLGEKANKEEIKRAFQFVEDKIKEIVMIIADDIQQEKEGAIRRIPFKCLSCDKDLESSTAHPHKMEGDKKALSRSSTSQIRKRIRMTISDDR